MPPTELPADGLSAINWHVLARDFLESHLDAVMAIYNVEQTRLLTCQDLDLVGRLLLDLWDLKDFDQVIAHWWRNQETTLGPENGEALRAHLGTILNMVCMRAFYTRREDAFAAEEFRQTLLLTIDHLKSVRSLM